MKKIYITTMYRYGSKKEHSYVIYVGFNEHKAKEAGREESKFRGVKYSHEVVEYIPDKINSQKIVHSLYQK